jgi:hypothetical protein
MQRLSPLLSAPRPFLFFSSYILTSPFSISPPFTQRTEIPDLLVNILDAIFIDANSWKSSLAA